MKTQVKALSMFVHGKVNADKGGTYELSKHEAEDLQKAGLVEIIGSEQEQPATEVLTNEKQAEPLDNKMAAAPANKAAKAK